MLGATIPNLVARATWRPVFMRPWCLGALQVCGVIFRAAALRSSGHQAEIR
jgi:hypothetical protein